MRGSADVCIERAEKQAQLGNRDGAIDALKEALSVEPDSAQAHAFLSILLVDSRRLHAGEIEAALALASMPELPLAQYAMAYVRLAQRRLSDAESLATTLIAWEPDDVLNHRLLADVYAQGDRLPEALAALDDALALDPESAETLAQIAEIHRRSGAIELAEKRSKEALAIEPQNEEALIVAGYIHLRRGHRDEARQHAVWALSNDPGSARALALLSAVKASESKLLGLWWKWSTWSSELDGTRMMLVLLGSYVVYRLLRQIAGDTGQPHIASVVEILWLGICAYTWVGPTLFARMVERELGKVELDGDF